jgi:N-acetylmuramoyl-L-alanine amidase
MRGVIPQVAAAMFVCAALGAGAGKPVGLSAVRFYSSAQTTTVTVELEAPVTPHKGSVGNPPRVFFDLPNTRVLLPGRGTRVIPVGDGVISQIRVAQYGPSVARVVLELERDSSVEVSVLADPVRLNFEVRPTIPKISVAASKTLQPAAAGAGAGNTPPRAEVVLANPPAAEAPAPESATAARTRQPLPRPKPEATTGAKKPAAGATSESTTAALSRPASAPTTPTTESSAAETANKLAPRAEESAAGEGPKPVPAARNSGGGRTLTRALGLKLARVVIDAGHGGHDEGTRGPTGLLEKDLVLDVAQRLGALIEEQLGADVVYTRTSNVFVPLEERTAIANRAEADLFLSLHANSSPYRTISGSDVYYLSFTTSKEALDVAARENAGTGKSIHELEDLVKKIALSEKVTESSEFANRIQRELYLTWNKLSGVTRNRGVKKAPFVVLIGANMPSVLAEIGFISNPHDESLLKKPEQRQRIAEALFRGVNAYASTLSRMDTPAEARQVTR